MIRATELTRSFDGRPAVERVSFSIGAGEVFALLGPNGAGKTTTLRMLAGLILPDSGSVAIDGVPMTRATSGAARGRIGFLTEAPGLWERLSVHANLDVYARLFEVADPAAAVRRELERFGLWDRRHDLAAVLSKGNKQKLALARALLHDPAVLLLDEPTSGLDPAIARTVRELIVSLRQQGRAILISTHNLDEAERIADRIGVLQTRLVALDTPANLRQRLFGHRVRITLSQPADAFADTLQRFGTGPVSVDGQEAVLAVEHPEAQVPDLVRALVAAGAAIQAVERDEAPLEDVYLRILREEPA